MNIYIDVLSYKLRNENDKYLLRYAKLIEIFVKRNKPSFSYIERHHIFPAIFCDEIQIKDKLNFVSVSAREHFILHLLLSKMNYKFNCDHRSMYFALSCFSRNKAKRKLTSRQYDTSRKAVIDAMSGRYVSDITKNKLSNYRMGKANFYDDEGNSYLLYVNDPIIKELNLVGNQSKKTISINSSGEVKALSKTDQRLISGEYIPIMKNKATYIDKEGKNITLNINDPLIQELELVHINKGRKFKMPAGSNKGSKNGMFGRSGEVCCFDLIEEKFLRIKKELFDKNERYVGINNLKAKEFRKNNARIT